MKSRNNWGILVLKCKLSDLSNFIMESASFDEASVENYVSTESMIADRGGITEPSALPKSGSIRRYRPGDVLISNIRPYFKKIWRATRTGTCSNDVLVIRSNGSCNPAYLYYVLSSDDFFNYMTATSKGTKMPRGDKEAIMDYEIDLPSIEQQEQFTSTMSKIDDLIWTNSKINDYLSDLASEIFNHYIGSIRSKMPFENLISLGSGGTPRTSVSEYWNGQIPFFSPKDVSGCYVYKTEKNITQDGLNNCNSRLYPQNTIIITARGTVGKICLTAKPMAMNQSCYAVLSKNGTVYTTYLLCKYIVKKLKHKASGAVFDAITAQDILKEEIPNIDSTTAIMLESRLSHIFTMILKIGEESARLIQIRDCLLKDLFLSSR